MTHTVAFLSCTECKNPDYPWKSRTWRYGCVDCAESFKAFHESEFGHTVELVVRPEPNPWKHLQDQAS